MPQSKPPPESHQKSIRGFLFVCAGIVVGVLVLCVGVAVLQEDQGFAPGATQAAPPPRPLKDPADMTDREYAWAAAPFAVRENANVPREAVFEGERVRALDSDGYVGVWGDRRFWVRSHYTMPDGRKTPFQVDLKLVGRGDVIVEKLEIQ